MQLRRDSSHPVLHHLATLRAARDFGLRRDQADRLTQRFPPGSGRTADFAEAAATAVLGRSSRLSHG